MSEQRNEFRAPKQLCDGTKNPDVRNYCEMFKMTAVDENDMKFLAHLYRAIFISGGSIVIADGECTQIYEVGR
jgi:hypothetical protein